MDAQQVQDWVNLGMVGNSIAMDWYAMTHDQPLPSQSLLERTLGADLGAVQPRFGILAPDMGITGTHILLIGAVGIGLFLLLR